MDNMEKLMLPIQSEIEEDIYADGASATYYAIREAQDFSLFDHLQHQQEWSAKTFGPAGGHVNLMGVIDHIEKEIKELKSEPFDLEEWIDLLILASDGAWRAGHSPEDVIAMWKFKQAKNESRNWPDWRTAEPGKAIEHIRDGEEKTTD